MLKSRLFRSLLCCVATLSFFWLQGCATMHTPSALLVKHDKRDYMSADEERKKADLGPVQVSMKTDNDASALNVKIQKINSLMRDYMQVLQNREKGAAYSVWLYAAHYRMGEMNEQLATIVSSMISRYKSAGTKYPSDSWDTLAKKSAKLCFRRYTMALFMGHFHHKQLPGVVTHTLSGNPWLRKTEAAYQRVGKRLGMSNLQVVKVLTKVYSRVADFDERKKIATHILTFIKKHPLRR